MLTYSLCFVYTSYVSDASRGAILVHETFSDSEWTVLACSPAVGLQIAMVKRGLTHNVLILVRLHHPGLLEMDTASLRRRNTNAPIRGAYGPKASKFSVGRSFTATYQTKIRSTRNPPNRNRQRMLGLRLVVATGRDGKTE